jgi:hypothetical protein
MRWRIRTQILVPLLILLLGVAGITTWIALSSANQARLQIEMRVRGVAHTLGENRFPLNDQEILCRHLHKEAAEWVTANPGFWKPKAPS